jgi:hypothetical protein
MRGIGHSRRRFAITACVLWLLGVEVLPNVHLAHHDHHHTHAADGSIVSTEVDDHHDADAAVFQHASADRDELAIDHPIESGHQAGGVAHHAIALHQPAPPLLVPLPVVRTELRVESGPAAQLCTLTTALSMARGPPAIA